MVRAQKSDSHVGHTMAQKGRGKLLKSHAQQSLRSRSLSHPVTNAERKGAAALPAERPKVDVQYQTAIKNFEIGVRAFQKQNYQRAAEIFEKLVQNDARDVAERAHVHLRLCRQRTGRAAPHPKSADDFYALGVACLNARQFNMAVENLVKADKMKPRQEHIQYALAVSHSLGGNSDAAITHLEAAFTLRPENRIHARRDEDFQGLATDPRFRRLIYPAGI